MRRIVVSVIEESDEGKKINKILRVGRVYVDSELGFLVYCGKHIGLNDEGEERHVFVKLKRSDETFEYYEADDRDIGFASSTYCGRISIHSEVSCSNFDRDERPELYDSVSRVFDSARTNLEVL